MKNIRKNAIFAYIGFLVLMIALGASDAMRGVFIPIFGTHFALSNSQLSGIITVSYIGNLVFLLFGGRLADREKRKPAFLFAACLWLAAVVFYLMTDNYYCLLIGMFFSMGASTLTSTLINVMTSYIFVSAPAAIVSTLFFIQGLGTTGSQKLAGKFAEGFGSWKVANCILLVIGVIGIIVLMFVHFPDRVSLDGEKEQKKFGFLDVAKNRVYLIFVFAFGFYFIAEHSIMNWFVTFGTQAFGLSMDQSSTYLALFFGGIMVGRLIFAPVVQKLGIKKSIFLFGGIATILYAVGGLIGGSGLMILVASGLFFSILYPTMVMMIQNYYPVNGVTTATGMIISTATLFDIGWNAVYGILMDKMGAGNAFLLLPAAMVLFFVMSVLLLRFPMKEDAMK
ncbi:MAG: MFS transporter [Candidatus Merdivicinus sp.]